jgi:Ca-activated chloride channel family protein
MVKAFMFELTGIEFVNPWIFVILPLPLMVYFLVPAYRESQDSIRVPFFKRLVELTGQKPQKGAVVLQRVLFQKVWIPTIWILIVVALARPFVLGEPIEQTKSARDLMIAVDLSGSMEARDFKAADGDQISRLAAVKLVLAEFVDQREHDRLGLIVFGDSPYLQAPFTEDHQTWLTLLEETEIAMAGQSTVFGDAIGLAIKLFEASETDNRVLIVLTDGNDTGSKVPPIEAAKVAAHKQVTIYTIAVGDPETVGEEALDLDVMEAIAELTGGYHYEALDREQLQKAYRDIAELEPEDYETLSFRPRLSLFHYPLGVVFIGYLLFFTLMMWRARVNKLQAAHD